MGNAVRLSIRLDCDSQKQTCFKAGTALRGTVIAEVRKNVSGEVVVLFVKGKEKASVKRGKHTRYAHRVLFHAEALLRDNTSHASFTAGTTYSFPFSVELPDSLPSSVRYGGRPNECSVQYKCVAQIGKARTELAFSVVSADMQNVRVPCFLEPTTQEVKSMGILSKGTISCGAGVEDTYIGKGQELALSVACRNDTTVDIERVCYKVVEVIHWKCNEGYTCTLKKVLVPMTELNLPGLVKRRKSRSEVRQDQRAGPGALRQSNYREIYEELFSGQNSVRIRIPPNASDSYEGALLSVSHYIKIYLQTPKLVRDVETKIPLKIGFPAQIATMVAATPAAIHLVPTAPNDDLVAIPFATAVELPFGTVEAPMVVAPAEAIVIGGTATTCDSNVTSSFEFSDLVPVPPPQVHSLQGLLEEMTASVNDYDIISHKLKDPQWRRFFSSLTPADYGEIIAHVNMDFDQPRVAEILAPSVQLFTCAYCVSAIQTTAQWNRMAMVQTLLPHCVDITIGFEAIQAELTPWERTVTADDFQMVLDHSNR